MKSGNIQLGSFFKPLIHFVRRFHTILFFLLVSISLFIAILLIMDIISLSSQTSTSSNQTVSGSFDEETINRLQQSTAIPPKPAGRQSPFTE